MKPDQLTTILIADDHPMFRRGLRDVIRSERTFYVIGEAGDGEEALAIIEREKPSIAVLDLDMPKKSGLEVTTYIIEKGLPVSVLILTMYNEEEMFNKALRLGVMGYILKDSAVLDIVKGIASVARGEYFFSASLTNHLIKTNHTSNNLIDQHAGVDKLTSTERRILHLIADNKVTSEIADALYISPRTVEHHRAHICEKLGVTGAYALVRFALQNKALL
jgi:DNA-binding NarL/FixJ family response regulator